MDTTKQITLDERLLAECNSADLIAQSIRTSGFENLIKLAREAASELKKQEGILMAHRARARFALAELTTLDKALPAATRVRIENACCAVNAMLDDEARGDDTELLDWLDINHTPLGVQGQHLIYTFKTPLDSIQKRPLRERLRAALARSAK